MPNALDCRWIRCGPAEISTLQKCSGCHVLYAPQEYPDHVWLDQVIEMKGKALISERDVELILAYVRGMNGA